MKHYILILVIALISCSTSDDPAPAKQTTFESISGAWVFKDGDISGTVTFAEFSGDFVVDNVGQYSIKSVHYDITEKRKVNFGSIPGTILSFHLINDDDTYLSFHEGDINSSYTEITCKMYSYGVNGSFDVIQHKVVLIRK